MIALFEPVLRGIYQLPAVSRKDLLLSVLVVGYRREPTLVAVWWPRRKTGRRGRRANP
jgi:hypothetical protein